MTATVGAGRRRGRRRTVALFVALLTALGGLGLAATPAGAAANPAFSAFDIPNAPYPPGTPAVALTFDDGPSPQITPGVLDTLAAHHAVATFFVVGQWAAAHPDLVRRAVALGNTVQLHTMTHRDLTRSTAAQIAAEVDPEIPLLEALTGRRPTCLRPPYGAWNNTVVSTLAARGIETVMWSVNPGDTESGATVGSITTRALAGARPGAIIALHDSETKQATLAALPGILDGLRARGLGTLAMCGPTTPPPPKTVDVAVRADGAGYTLDADGGLHAFGGAPGVGGFSLPHLARRVVLRVDGTSGYVLDGWGGLHPFGGAPAVTATAYWPNWDIARGVGLRADGRSGWVLDGFGGIHPFGGAPTLAPSAFWSGWDIARAVAATHDGNGGYVLDGFGALHPFGTAAPVSGSSYRAGDDHARALTLGFDDRSGWVLDQTGALLAFGSAPPARVSRLWLADAARGVGQAANGLAGAVVDDGGTVAAFTAGPATRSLALRGDGTSGYTLDASGRLRAFGGAPAATGAPSWPNWDIARGVAVAPSGAGYVLDGLGGLHAVNGAPAVSGPRFTTDLARAVAVRADGRSGYVLDAWGGIHAFGGAPRVTGTAYWSGWDIARGITLRADGVSGWTIDGFGGIHPFGGAPAVTPSAYWSGWDIARGIASRADGASGWVLDGWGAVHPFGGAPSLGSPVHEGRPVVVGLTSNPGGSDHPAVVDAYGHVTVL